MCLRPCLLAGASDDAADSARPGRRRNKAQSPTPTLASASGTARAPPLLAPPQSVQASHSAAHAASSLIIANQHGRSGNAEPRAAAKPQPAAPDVAGSGMPAAAHEKQKPARKRSQGIESAPGAELPQQAQHAQHAQQQQPETLRHKAGPSGTAAVAPGAPHSSAPKSSVPSVPVRPHVTQAAAVMPPQQQQQKQQQQPHSAAPQHAIRPPPPAGNSQAPPRQGSAPSRGLRPVPNYSAAVSGMVQSTAALSVRDADDATPVTHHPNKPAAAAAAASAVQLATTKGAPATAAPPATTAAAASGVHHNRKQQPPQQQQQPQQIRQVPQKLQQAVSQQNQAGPSLPASVSGSGPAGLHHPPHLRHHQHQQQQQQPGFMQHLGLSVGPQHLWDVPAAAVSTPQQAAQLNLPGVDWSFQAPSGAPPGGPGAAGFGRTASSSNLAPQQPWAAGQLPGTAAGRSDGFDGNTSRLGSEHMQAAAGSRASTSGFVVASPPSRAGHGNNRGPAGGSVRPSAGILSVQMNIAGQPRPSAPHAPPAGLPGGQAPYTGMGSAGQPMGVSLPSSMANNIWAVGDGKTDSLGTSAEQRPDMWASPSRSSPVRRAGAYSGPGVGRQPSLSHASEIRRVAEASGLCCPITKDLMSDPVVLISDGYTYERAAITKWLEQNETSPITEAPLQHKDMVPNLTMRSAIQLLIPSANSQRLFPSQLERRHI